MLDYGCICGIEQGGAFTLNVPHGFPRLKVRHFGSFPLASFLPAITDQLTSVNFDAVRPELSAGAEMECIAVAIEVEWKTLLPDSKEWHHTHVLYAYVHPVTGNILYVGKAWHRTVRQRFRDRDKRALFGFLSDEFGLSGVEVRVGEVWMDGRLTRQLLSDVESLLIKRLQPAGNIMCRSSRISRRGMRLECFNEWPHKRARFVDR